ncbi:hypothetical protein [Hyalangium versicolor]|uniref:hypothetical protein n=1 Tax=Hyalangium versicolor TaxID=2861190 RepID=UPI001CCA7B84|nr:hypothetical protein [Hyalangium versicolor]
MFRFFRALSALALTGMLTHCATSSGASGSASGDAVKLRFAWPEGLAVKVASTNTATQNAQPPEQSTLSYQLRLEGKGEERKLITEQMTPAPGTAEEGPQLPTPAIVLGPQGELKRIEGVEQIVQDMAREAESQGLPKEQQEQITGLVRDALEQATRLRWAALVGKWNGLALKPGEAFERKSQTTVPLFGSSAGTVEHVTLKERVPCTEGAAEKRCVRLVLESSLDPKALDQSMEELLKRVKSFMKANMGLMDVAIPEMKVTKLSIDSTLEFIAEPETLIPHRQRTVTNAHVVLQETEGEPNPKNFDLHNERVEDFTPVAR